jgi:predicted MPP superfamily phosphohydrolase
MFFSWMLSSVVAVMNRYLWHRFVRDTRLGPKASKIIGIALLALTISIPATFVYWRLISRSATPGLTVVAFGWLGASFYLVAIFLGWDLLRSVRWLVMRGRQETRASETEAGTAPPPSAAGVLASHTNQEGPARDTRRVFMARSVASGALLAAGGISTLGVRSALWEITTPEIPVRLARLPRQLDGFSIALLTDVHIGALLDGRYLRHLTEQTNRLRPDLIAIGGDLVDGRVSQIGAQVAELRRLRAPYGVHFVTGNHEYYSDASQWTAFLERMGVRVLTNERVSIGDLGRKGASFDLAGVPDCRAAHIGEVGPNIHLATAGRDADRELVVLAHQPVQIEPIAAAGAGLQLSGHTHGGQLYPFGSITRLAQPYLSGLHRHGSTDTQIYVSRGTGFWGPPMRVLAPAEVALLRLHAG